ncbi:MAG: hypothetical protein ACFFAZ_13455 [Promethearchaeota archaeon]
MARSIKRAWWALAFMFAAVQMVLTLFPLALPIDGTGGYFSIDLVSPPVIGYLLGPFYGTVSVLFGTFMAVVVDPWSAGGFMGTLGILAGIFVGIPPAAGALVAGLIRNGRNRIVSLFFIIAIGLFLITQVGLLVYSFLWLHIITLLLSFLFLIPHFKKHLKNGMNLSAGTSYSKVAIAIWLLVFISVMADHLVASVIRAYIFLAVPADSIAVVYTGVTFIYPIERILASIAGAIIIILIAVAITGQNLHLPTRPTHEKEIVSIEPSNQESLPTPSSAE